LPPTTVKPAGSSVPGAKKFIIRFDDIQDWYLTTKHQEIIKWFMNNKVSYRACVFRIHILSPITCTNFSQNDISHILGCGLIGSDYRFLR
jgi:hypothetical protein